MLSFVVVIVTVHHLGVEHEKYFYCRVDVLVKRPFSIISEWASVYIIQHMLIAYCSTKHSNCSCSLFLYNIKYKIAEEKKNWKFVTNTFLFSFFFLSLFGGTMWLRVFAFKRKVKKNIFISSSTLYCACYIIICSMVGSTKYHLIWWCYDCPFQRKVKKKKKE